jgi:hypothetical protein
MPYDTVGGFPSLPTQVTRGTVHEPKQSLWYLTSQSPRWRARRDVPNTRERHHQTPTLSVLEGGVEVSTGDLSRTAAHTCLSSAASSSSFLQRSARQSSCQGGGGSPHRRSPADGNAMLPRSTEGNPWSVRTTVEALEERRLHGVNGVVAWRPILYTTLAAAELPTIANTVTSSPPVASPNQQPVATTATLKPLLKPFSEARELAGQASEETWHTRRLRYLQWLRKGALVAKNKQGATAEWGIELSAATADCFPSVSRPMLTGDSTSVLCGTAVGDSAHTLLPALDERATGRGGGAAEDDAPRKVSRVFRRPVLNKLNASRLEADSILCFPPVASTPNPNEVAVRQLFRLAHSNVLPLVSSPAAAAKHGPDGGGGSTRSSIKEGEEEDGVADQVKKMKFSLAPSAASTNTVTPGTSQVIQAPLLGDRQSHLDLGDNFDSFSLSLALRDESESGDGGDTASTTSKSIVELSPEYAVADLLRKRMHNTVATFTASAAHTLDAPPRKTTRRIFGQARLQGGGVDKVSDSVMRNACPRDAVAGRADNQCAGVDDDNGSAVVATEGTGGAAGRLPPPRPLSTRTVRRLIYEEAYERGLLMQLAFQSSPTRWYSSELPSGQDGIAFRKVYPPEMKPDAELQARLNSATARAIQSIALPRQEEMLATAERHNKCVQSPYAQGNMGVRRLSLTSSNQLLCTDTARTAFAAGVQSPFNNPLTTIEEASKEKSEMFVQWTRLHRNLSAQWQLFQEEEVTRLRLLGHFVSCAHPEPCVCLECDQEVLNMSAIPLEPKVKLLCWYTSVVLRGHHEVLQKEMLRQHAQGLAALHALFRVLFIATYTRQKLLEEEARRFQMMIRYHQFCLRVAAQNAREPAPATTTATTGSSSKVAAAALCSAHAEELEQGVQSLTGMEPRMWRLRQRRLQAYKVFESPFFSFLVYTEMITVASAEERVRRRLCEEEAAKRKELVALMRQDEKLSALFALERRQRSWIAAEMMEANSAMLTGPLVQLHAAHMAELRENAAAGYAKMCAKVRQTFVNAAYAEKHAATEESYAAFNTLMRGIRQQFLTLLVAKRSAATSMELSHYWLNEQRQSVLVRREQRLRDQLVLDEEPAAFQAIVDSAVDSLHEAGEREAQRRVVEQAEAEAVFVTAARLSSLERARETAELQAQKAREDMMADPRLRPSAKLPGDNVNNFTKLTMTLREDFLFFLPELD